MKKNWVFDGQEQQKIHKYRKEFLEHLLRSLFNGPMLKTALDAGCGIGFFANYLSSLGLRVTAFDGRGGNVEEARVRYPQVEFHISDVEDLSIRELGSFDLVLCFGLIYHLENPFRAIRNLHDVTAKILIIESMITPSLSPVATLVNESQGDDQGLRYDAFIPSEACLIKMLYHAGFPEVYKTIQLPDHEDFRKTVSHQRRRTVLVASKVALQSALLQCIAEPEPQRPDLWEKKLTRFINVAYGVLLPIVRTIFHRFLFQFPWPIRLPWGGWWIAWNDVMGKHIRLHENFEQEEQSFLLRFFKPGMVALDVGAHQGLYTLLASRKVGVKGQVIAFEPSPRELRRLRWNLALNRCRNVHIEPFAVSNTEKTAELFVCLGQETGCNSLRPPAVSEPVRKVQVTTTTLDSYLQRNGINKVDFIKLDAEGAELEVLQGAIGLLRTSRPVILCELADIRTEPWGYRSVEIYNFLEERNYQWFSVMAGGKLQSSEKTSHPENLIAVPKEKLSELAGYITK
ncbi:MAG TPA: FkbM family methyltransferase [Thermodesulfobacteriota bacterium]|nr:FkbM family methyltransferase [Thermodesulfobacteriota bacterium]